MNQPAKRSLHSTETIPPQRTTDSASVPLLPFVTLPAQFGRFRVERLLGQGVIGAVYFASDTQLERAVALKVPRLTGAEDSDIVHRLLREAIAAANLNHPHICRVYDVGSESGTSFIAMEFIAGRPLSDYIALGHFPAAVVRRGGWVSWVRSPIIAISSIMFGAPRRDSDGRCL